MIASIGNIDVVNPIVSNYRKNQNNRLTTPTTSNTFAYSKAASEALKLNSLNYAKTIKFTGALVGAFQDLNSAMVTCKTENSKGEEVGSVANVNHLLFDFNGEFKQVDDAIKTTIKIGEKEVNGRKLPYYARTQVKMVGPSDIEGTNDLMFEMAVRKPSDTGLTGGKCDKLPQLIDITLTPTNYKGQGTKEQAYILNTKGNLMAAVEGPDDVILTNAGTITKKNPIDGALEVVAIQRDEYGNPNTFVPFNPEPQPVLMRAAQPSEGKGTEVIIGMENERFVDEIKASIKSFVEKVQNKKIVLDKFVEAPNAKNTQLIMLAGGFGSRAEYANASSSAIFHNKKNGSQCTKGVFRTATGLTPMETTFVTLHKAGLLNCSADTLKIGDNIKFYLNKDINRGNGGYTVGLSKKMDRQDAKSIMVLPNDSMSRMTNAVIKAKQLIDSGDAAIAMIAKKVAAKDCIKNFGIMKLGHNNEILEFAEKPETIPAGYADRDNMCLTNTFQFTVSKEALKVLDLVEPFYNPNSEKKETRDWSKQYIPVIQYISQLDNNDEIRNKLAKSFGYDDPKEFRLDDETIRQAKAILGKQKLIAVPTDEPWADCGSLNQLYYTTMQIAHNNFKLEDFERANVLRCVDTRKGLIASYPEQLKRVLKKYNVTGQVMAVPMAKKVDPEYIKDIPVVVNEPSELV